MHIDVRGLQHQEFISKNPEKVFQKHSTSLLNVLKVSRLLILVSIPKVSSKYYVVLSKLQLNICDLNKKLFQFPPISDAENDLFLDSIIDFQVQLSAKQTKLDLYSIDDKTKEKDIISSFKDNKLEINKTDKISNKLHVQNTHDALKNICIIIRYFLATNFMEVFKEISNLVHDLISKDFTRALLTIPKKKDPRFTVTGTNLHYVETLKGKQHQFDLEFDTGKLFCDGKIANDKQSGWFYKRFEQLFINGSKQDWMIKRE